MRTVEKFDVGELQWVEIPFETLVEGDVFRFFDDGERYVNKADGNNVWIATSLPYINDEGVWAITTLY